MAMFSFFTHPINPNFANNMFLSNLRSNWDKKNAATHSIQYLTIYLSQSNLC